jgi:hypothetical protein
MKRMEIGNGEGKIDKPAIVFSGRMNDWGEKRSGRDAVVLVIEHKHHQNMEDEGPR